MPDPTEQHFRGTLTERDVKRNLRHAVNAAAAATRIRVQLSFDPAMAGGHRNMICITVFDPAGVPRRRPPAWQSARRRDCPRRGDPASCPVRCRRSVGDTTGHSHGHAGGAVPTNSAVAFDHGDAPPAAATMPVAPRFERVVDRRAGWYRGDLHAHTVHSDGNWEVADLVAAARTRGLDFVTLTDHNTTGGLAAMARHSGDALLTIGGQELTTFWGHALCLGGHRWHDWRVTQTGPELAVLAERMLAAGELFVIAHPRTEGDPHCTGCRWLYPGMMPGAARLVEVWNGEWFGGARDHDRNEAALQLWYRWLNEGHRMVATAGTDVHGPGRQYQSPHAGFSTVYAGQPLRGRPPARRGSRSPLPQQRAEAQLHGGPRGRRPGHDGRFPDRLRSDRGGYARDGWDGVPEAASLRLIADGEARQSSRLGTAGKRTWSFSGSRGGALVRRRSARTRWRHAGGHQPDIRRSVSATCTGLPRRATRRQGS